MGLSFYGYASGINHLNERNGLNDSSNEGRIRVVVLAVLQGNNNFVHVSNGIVTATVFNIRKRIVAGMDFGVAFLRRV